jgi:two-component system NtrC family sensor kinase
VRLGVSAKIFLAYAVLLVAFAASSILSVVYLHRGEREMAAHEYRRLIQGTVDDLRQALNAFSQVAPAPGALPSRPTGRVAAISAIPSARSYLDDGRRTVERYLAEQAPDSAGRVEFELYEKELVRLGTRLDEVAAFVSRQGGAQTALDSPLTYLIDDVRKLSSELTKGSRDSAGKLLALGKRAVEYALLLGGVGLLAAIGAALFMLRTLRPLRVLRLHARQIAGGDYGRRISVPSRDEIGDLAREFDAMGRAIQEREQRLIRSERLATVGRMAAQITHEIRNPLASLGLYVELLGDELPSGGGEARRLVTAIGTEIDRLSEITETYLRFVRLPRPKREREDLGTLVTAVMEFARAELSMSGVTLVVRVDPGLPEVAADENQIRQALLNLVRNAKEAMPGGGRLDVHVGVGGPGHLRVAIADSGPGIAPEHLGNIFDPFFSTKDKGTGLGLSLVQQIVAEHGGRVEVASGTERGTVFAIILPLLASQDSEPPVSAAVPAAPAEAREPDEVLAAAAGLPRAR